MPRALTIQRTLVTPPDRERFHEKLRRKQEYYTKANCRFWVFEEAGLPGAFLEFFEAVGRRDAGPGACRGARAGARSQSRLCRSGVEIDADTYARRRRQDVGSSFPPDASRSTTATSSASSS